MNPFCSCLALLGLVLVSGASAADVPHCPYHLDGWERTPAPLIDLWMVAGPADEATRDLLVAAEPIRNPLAGDAAEGLVWRELDSMGRAVALPEGLVEAGRWTVAQAFVSGGGVVTLRANISFHGAERLVLFQEGKPVAELSAAEPRREAVAVELLAGWNRFHVAILGGPEGAPRFYLQLAGTDELAPEVNNLARLNAAQLSDYATAQPLAARAWKRVKDRQLSLLAAPFSDLNRQLAVLSVRVQRLPERARRAEDAAQRLRNLRRLARLVVYGGTPAAVVSEYQIVANQLRAHQGMEADQSEVFQRVFEETQAIGPWLQPPSMDRVAWNALEGGTTIPEARVRLRRCERLLCDLLEYGRMVVSEAEKSL